MFPESAGDPAVVERFRYLPQLNRLTHLHENKLAAITSSGLLYPTTR